MKGSTAVQIVDLHDKIRNYVTQKGCTWKNVQVQVNESISQSVTPFIILFDPQMSFMPKDSYVFLIRVVRLAGFSKLFEPPYLVFVGRLRTCTHRGVV